MDRHRYRLRKSLAFETLEERTVMAATLTATLIDGMLRVEGTDLNDKITLKRNKTLIQLEGMKQSFLNANVKSVVIESLAGNDTIRFDGLNTGGLFGRPILVHSSGGSDNVRGLDGKQLFFNGDHALEQDGKGQTLLDGKAPDWFDYNLRDDALRQLLKEDFADQVVNRQEMLDVFQQVAQDQKVSAVEFEDLKAVARNDALFNTVSYVGVLTRDVVLGNKANQYFQGTKLGNLVVGSSAVQLNKLVGKWFLGADHPQATYGGYTFTYTVAAGSLFGAQGPQYSDVQQGAVGDCYFVGALAEIALRSPTDLTSMFIVNGDGTYTVRFYNNGTADYVTVDAQLPVDWYGRFVFANMGQYANSSNNVLWVAMAEKAYVQMNEVGWLRSRSLPGGGKNSYQAISGGMMSDVLRQVCRQSSVNASIGTSAASFTQFVQAYDSGKMIGFASTGRPASSLVVGGHQYVVVGYDAQAGTVTLFNPWGLNNGSRYPGLLTLSWVDVQRNFGYWTRSA